MSGLFEIRKDGSIRTAWIVMAVWFIFLLMYGNGSFNSHYFPYICLLLFVFITNCAASDIVESGKINFYGILAPIVASICAAFGYVYGIFDKQYWSVVFNYGGEAAREYAFDSSDVFASEQFTSLLIPMILVGIICIVLAKVIPNNLKLVTYGVVAVLMLILFKIKLEEAFLINLLFAVFSFLSALYLILCERLGNTKKKDFIPLCGAIIGVIVMFTMENQNMLDEIFMFMMVAAALLGSIIMIFGKTIGFKISVIPCTVMLFAYFLTHEDPATFLIPVCVCLVADGISVISFLKKDEKTSEEQ